MAKKVQIRWQGKPYGVEIPALLCGGLQVEMRHEAGANFNYVTYVTVEPTNHTAPQNIDAALALVHNLGLDHNIHAEVLVDGMSLLSYLTCVLFQLEKCVKKMDEAAKKIRESRRFVRHPIFGKIREELEITANTARNLIA